MRLRDDLWSAPGLLPDQDIKHLCSTDEPMIDPFVPDQIRGGVDSEGRARLTP